jgi:hypothetical protein
MKTFKVISTAALLSGAILVSSVAFAGNNEKGRGTGPTVFVTTQGLYYDSIVVAELPKKGRFQKLVPTDVMGVLYTEFGPGDVGYLGGRWYIDVNDNDEVDYDEPTFLCPLLGPGEE